MENITHAFQRISIAFFLLISCNLNLIAACSPGSGIANSGTISGPTTICSGLPATYTFSGATCATSGCTIERMIKVYSGNTLVYSSTLSNAATDTFTPQNSGSYTVRGYVKAVGSSSFCETANCIYLNVCPTPSTPSWVCTPVNACSGQSFNLTGTPASGCAIRWYKNGVLIGTGNSISYSEAVAGTYTYEAYSYNSSSGCQSSTFKTVTAYITDKPTASISGPVTGETYVNYTFSTPAVSGATYDWVVSSSATIVSGAGTNTVVIHWNSSGNKTISVTVSKNGCEDTDNHIICITSCPVACITRLNDICKTNTQCISTIDQGSGVSYNWNFGSGASPATSNSKGPHNVTYSTTGSKTVTLTVTKSGCSPKTVTSTFNVTELPNITLTGPNNVFVDTAYTYNATNVSGATYEWYADGDAIITGSGSSVKILFPSAGYQRITLHVLKDGCDKCTIIDVCARVPICRDTKFDYTKVPLRTSMKNYTHVDASTGNKVTLNKKTTPNDSFHTSRKFSRDGDTAVSWQENRNTVSKMSIKFNRSANDLNFSIRDLDKSTAGQELIKVYAYYRGNQISIDDIYTYYSSTNIEEYAYTSTTLTYRGRTSANNRYSSNDIEFYFDTKVDSVFIELWNTNTSSSSPDLCPTDVGVSPMCFCITEPVPVTWLAVNALKSNTGGVNINWATATEINNDYFTVEKSTDNRNFKEIAQVKGAGNKSTISKYVFEDNNPGAGTVYYRIKQTDYDGKFDYSPIVAISPGKLLNNVTVSPNPASSNVTVTWDAGIREQLSLKITDLKGVTIVSETLSTTNNIHYLNVQNMINGIYVVNIVSKDNVVYRSG